MSATSRALTEANHILRDLDSVYPGYTPPLGKFQVKWSMDLISLVPEYRVSDYEAWDPQPVMEYRCYCGVDKRVHLPECKGITVAKVKLKKVSTCGLEGEFKTYRNCYLLCRWIPPVPKEDWIDCMGTDEDYPSEGTYVPVSRGAQCIGFPRNTKPEDFPRVAKLMVQRMTLHFHSLNEEMEKSKKKQRMLMVPILDKMGNVVRDADPESPYHAMKDRIQNKLRTFNPGGTVGYTKEIEGAGTPDNDSSLTI